VKHVDIHSILSYFWWHAATIELHCKIVPNSINEHWAQSSSWSLGHQPAGDLVINPTVYCHYCPPGQRLPPNINQRASMPLDWYRIIVFGERGTEV